MGQDGILQRVANPPHVRIRRISRALSVLILGSCVSFAAPPLQMKLLVISATGSEPSLAAIRSFLDHLGTPYETVLAGKNQVVPILDDGTVGNYQGIILVPGNLGVCDPDCHSALAPEDWAKLESYAIKYSVRTLSYYTYPEPRYGLRLRDNPAGAQDTSSIGLTADGIKLFPYLSQSRNIPIAGAFAYPADPIAAPGETTVPLLRIGDATVAVTHTTSDGREFLALTLDNSPVLRHSLLLNYGLISWVTRGVFLGSRRIYLTPQSDDLFLADNQFMNSGGACTPTAFVDSPANPAPPGCPKLRIASADLANVRNWQSGWNSNPQTNRFKVTIAYNGVGIKPDSADDLVAEAQFSKDAFFWINHTYNHFNLDCYTGGLSGNCRPATYEEALFEIQRNFEAGRQIGIPFDPMSIVSPGLSGLKNSNVLRAAADSGVRFLISDFSTPDGSPSRPNTGVLTPLSPNLLFVPRLATNIFYNATTPAGGKDGSETDEYNYFFGPDGLVRVGGEGGPPFFATYQTYSQILERESDALLQLMLRYEPYPCMFHQSNFSSYDGARSLFTDVIERTLQKFTDISNLPVLSLTQSDIGKLLEERMGWLNSGARATLVPGESITITALNGTVAPITGVCVPGCDEFGGDKQSGVPVRAGETVTIQLPH